MVNWNRDEDCTSNLPLNVANKGYNLTYIPPTPDRKDPVILDLNGREIFRWDYVPNYGEVKDKCRELGLI